MVLLKPRWIKTDIAKYIAYILILYGEAVSHLYHLGGKVFTHSEAPGNVDIPE